jgi:rubrerythrin
MTVIDFSQAKKDRTPHCTAAARCLQCGHEWTATAPAGVVWLECPECRILRGAFIEPAYPHDGQVWQCNCGNQLFLITPDGEFCPVCGVYVTE